ncbi:hypothetical protein ACM0BE_25140 [Mycobacteroides abscessus subsp. abscessus]|uniref:hypothetical protein n=1 Tax=Mycobacteroides abscessus TaxID=36809 RepID=UPI0039F10276
MTIAALYSKDNAPGRARHGAVQGWLITVTGSPDAVRAADECLANEGAYTRIICSSGERTRVKLSGLITEPSRQVAVGAGRVQVQYVVPSRQRGHDGALVSLDALMLYRAVERATDIGVAVGSDRGHAC